MELVDTMVLGTIAFGVGVRLPPQVPFTKDVKMPERFLQLNVPCKECLVSSICQDKKDIDAETDQYELYDMMLTLRRWDESKKMYRKGLIEAWISMGKDIIFNMATDPIKGIPEEAQPVYLNSLIELASTLEWMINSTSWKTGRERDFDIADVKRKMQQAIAWLSPGSHSG